MPLFREGRSDQESIAPVVRRVGQNDLCPLTISPEDPAPYLVSTYGRIGCDAAAVVNILPDNTINIIVSHYDPTSLAAHYIALERAIKNLPSSNERFSFLIKASQPVANKAITQATDIDEISYLLSKRRRLPSDFQEVDLSHLNLTHLQDVVNDTYQLVVQRVWENDNLVVRISVPGTSLNRVIVVTDKDRRVERAKLIRERQQAFEDRSYVSALES